MSYKQTTNLYFRMIDATPPAGDGSEQESARRRLERSRKTILLGWIISMIGIVTYCFVMSSGDQQADLPSALAAQGALGWVAIVVILVGVGSWFVGCVGFLNGAADSSTESGDR